MTTKLSLPVSLGEALDKLTILDIKLTKILDSRKDDVQKEYDLLDILLKPYRVEHSYYYRILKEINTKIWELQEVFHGKSTTPEQGALICKQILDENDRRFRVKSKLNHISKSNIKEQKGYAQKKAFVYGHLGLGDMYWMNGAVRYLATVYDEVVVVCKERNKTNVATMYEDDPTIHLFVIEDDFVIQPFRQKRKEFEKQGFIVYACGVHIGAPIKEFPLSFYDDFGLDRNIRSLYFHVPRLAEAHALYNDVCVTSTNYIVIHQQSSTGSLAIWDVVKRKFPTTLILDVNTNHYTKEDSFYSAAEMVVGKPLLHYTILLERAFEIYMLESSVYCLASHLDLSEVKGLYCYNAFDKSNERIGVFKTARL